MCVNVLNKGISNKHKIPIKINIFGVNKTKSNNLFNTFAQVKNIPIKEKNKIIGFIYGYSLLKPNGKYMFYVHSVGVLPNYQGKGIGKELFKYMVEYLENEKKSYKYFLLTAEDNIIAQKLYRKYSNKECLQVYFEKNF